MLLQQSSLLRDAGSVAVGPGSRLCSAGSADCRVSFSLHTSEESRASPYAGWARMTGIPDCLSCAPRGLSRE